MAYDLAGNKFNELFRLSEDETTKLTGNDHGFTLQKERARMGVLDLINPKLDDMIGDVEIVNLFYLGLSYMEEKNNIQLISPGTANFFYNLVINDVPTKPAEISNTEFEEIKTFIDNNIDKTTQSLYDINKLTNPPNEATKVWLENVIQSHPSATDIDKMKKFLETIKKQLDFEQYTKLKTDFDNYSELTFMPVSTGGHWFLLYKRDNKWKLMDSLEDLSGYYTYFENIKLALDVTIVDQLPKQTGVWECGYFTLMYMFIVVNYNEAQIEEILKDDKKKEAFFGETARLELIGKLKDMYEYQYALDKDLGIPNKIVVFIGYINTPSSNTNINYILDPVKDLRNLIPEIQFELIRETKTKSKAPVFVLHVNPTDDELKEITEKAKKDMEITHFVYGVTNADDKFNQYNIHYFDTSKTDDQTIDKINEETKKKIKTLVEPPKDVIVVFSGIDADTNTSIFGNIYGIPAIDQFIEKLNNQYKQYTFVKGYNNIKKLSMTAIVFHYLYTSNIIYDKSKEVVESVDAHDIKHFIYDTRNTIGTSSDKAFYKNLLDELIATVATQLNINPIVATK